jgi:hypothetical protein
VEGKELVLEDGADKKSDRLFGVGIFGSRKSGSMNVF